MKRNYIIPSVYIISISASQMIAESVTIVNRGNYTDEVGADLVKTNGSYSDWDDDWSN